MSIIKHLDPVLPEKLCARFDPFCQLFAEFPRSNGKTESFLPPQPDICLTSPKRHDGRGL